MASGYTVDVDGTPVDLDSIFRPKSAATEKAGNVNYKVSNIDISNRYEKITVEGQQWDRNTNFLAYGGDLASIFAVTDAPTPTPTKSLTPSISLSATPAETPPITPSVSY